MTLPHFLEITHDLFFCSGARSAWSRGSGSKPSQAERQVSVFISWHFLHPYTSLFHSCSCFLVVKLKLEVTDSKRLNNLFTANGKYNHVTISYVWQSVYTVFDECFNHWDCAQALLFDWRGKRAARERADIPNSQMESFFVVLNCFWIHTLVIIVWAYNVSCRSLFCLKRDNYAMFTLYWIAFCGATKRYPV